MHTTAIALSTILLSSTAIAAEAFPWAKEQRLTGKGGALVWKVTRAEGETVIEGAHPKWTVVHKCAPDGSPRETVKTVDGRTSRIVWTKDGVEYTWDTRDKKAPRKIAQRGLWDGDTLDARLAGIGWSQGKSVEFKILDTEKPDGDVVPMRAESEGTEQCSQGACHKVRLRYVGFGAVFVAPWDYRFGASEGAPYYRYSHEAESFEAK